MAGLGPAIHVFAASSNSGTGLYKHNHPAWCYRLALPLLLAIVLLGGCSSFVVADTAPLSPSQFAPAGSETISTGGFRLSALGMPKPTPDLLVLVAISGGGKRSAAYSYGALQGMRGVPRRILVISIDGQNVQDSSVSQRRVVVGLIAGNTIDRLNFETMVAFDQQLKDVTKAIRAARCAQAPTVNGAPCDGVQSAFVQVSLSAMPPGPERDRLLAIPTGLTINRASVDALISAGRDAITTSGPIRRFLDSYSGRVTAHATVSFGVPG